MKHAPVTSQLAAYAVMSCTRATAEDGAHELDRPVQVRDDDAWRQCVVAVRHAFDSLIVACASKPSIDAGPDNRRVVRT